MSDDWNSVCKEWLADTQWVSAGGIVSVCLWHIP